MTKICLPDILSILSFLFLKTLTSVVMVLRYVTPMPNVKIPQDLTYACAKLDLQEMEKRVKVGPE